MSGRKGTVIRWGLGGVAAVGLFAVFTEAERNRKNYEADNTNFAMSGKVTGSPADDIFRLGTPPLESRLMAIDGAGGTDTLKLHVSSSNFIIDLGLEKMLGFRDISVINVENVAGADGDDDLRGSSSSNKLDGGDGDDYLMGKEGNDSLWGQQGNDTLIGGADDDLVIGGMGSDEIDGESGVDKIYGEEGDDFLKGGNGDDSISGGAGNDTLQGDEGVDYLEGNDGHDMIFGGPGDDVITGGKGNDRISGGDGLDLMVGGEGADIFFFSSGMDQLLDFELRKDRLDRSGIIKKATNYERGVYIMSGSEIFHLRCKQLFQVHPSVI